jgi:hypothetical protein
MGSERERKQVRLISVGFALAAPFSGRGEVWGQESRLQFCRSKIPIRHLSGEIHPVVWTLGQMARLKLET